jgi:GMP synthase-like glutamine amidotransferase
MNAHVLQHVAFEDIGSISTWLGKRGARLSYTRFYENPALPALEEIDLLIAMGGPMSVNDETEFSWLRKEKELIRSAIERGVPVLGICLGAQLIASALGSPVYRNPVKEIGWFPIEATTLSAAETFRFPPTCNVFHWHGETFDLPAGAVRLARSKVCENQAFQLNSNVIGLQFHLETTPESVRAIVENCSHELIPGPYIQPKGDLYAVADAAYTEINRVMSEVLSYITRVI